MVALDPARPGAASLVDRTEPVGRRPGEYGKVLLGFPQSRLDLDRETERGNQNAAGVAPAFEQRVKPARQSIGSRPAR
jgi:hypothetical protein